MSAVEEIHAALIEADVFIGLANELDPSVKNWGDRVFVLVEQANRTTSLALGKIELVLDLIGARWEREHRWTKR